MFWLGGLGILGRLRQKLKEHDHAIPVRHEPLTAAARLRTTSRSASADPSGEPEGVGPAAARLPVKRAHKRLNSTSD